MTMTRRLFFKCLCLIFLTQIWGNATCQDSLYFENLTSKEKYVLIVGIENVLKFDPSIDNILYNAESVMKTGVVFKIKPFQVGPVSLMLFSGTVMKGSIDFEAKFDKVELFKDQNPQVRLGKLPFSKKETKGYKTKLEVYVGNSNTPSSWEIISFDATCVPKSGEIFTLEHKSAILDKAIIDYLTKAKSGNVLIIENVKVRSLGGTILKIPGLSLEVG